MDSKENRTGADLIAALQASPYREIEIEPERYRGKIIRNAVRCKICGDVIESRSANDFVKCSCGACAVDGGLEYLRRLGSVDDCEELSEFTGQ